MSLTNYINGEFGQSCGYGRGDDGACTSKNIAQYGVTEKVEKINDSGPTALLVSYISFYFFIDDSDSSVEIYFYKNHDHQMGHLIEAIYKIIIVIRFLFLFFIQCFNIEHLLTRNVSNFSKGSWAKKQVSKKILFYL